MKAAMDELADLASPDAMSVSAPPRATVTGGARWLPTVVVLLCLLAGLVLLYRDTAVAMVSIWQRSETFAHAFLVPPIVLWLIWRRRAQLAAMVPRPTFRALLPMAAFALAWLVGDAANLNSVTQFSMMALLELATVSVIGLPAARAILFPLAFAFFAVPMGEVFVPQLMEWTAYFTVIALRLSGIPVFRDGLSFVIPSGSWSVVEACSGVRYLIASFMVGTLFAYLNYRSMRRRLAFMGVAILVPVLANWVRAYLIVLLGHLSGNKLAVGVDHVIYGWLFFGVVVLLMYWIGARWREPEWAEAARPVPATAPAFARVPAGDGFEPLIRTLAVATAAALLAAAPHVANSLVRGAGASQPQLMAPALLSDRWSVVAGKPIDWKPAYTEPSAEIDSVYSSEGRNVGLYVGYYREQDRSRKLIASTNVLVRSDDFAWSALPDGNRVVDVGGRALTLRAAVLHSRSTERGDLLVWRVYWVNGKFTSSDLVARAQIALGKLTGRGDDAAVVVLYTAAGDGEKTLEAFTGTNLGVIEALLQSARGAQR